VTELACGFGWDCDADMSSDAQASPPAGLELVTVEPGREDDLQAIVEILNYTIMNSNAALDTQPVSVDERREWFERFAATGPYRLFVARRGGQVLGYAASRPYREHEGFRETVEVSIALDVTSRGQGVGFALYEALLASLADEPVHVALAGIVLPNDASIALHRKFGFTEVGIFREYAVKNGQYLSSVWMERRFPRHRRPGAADPANAPSQPRLATCRILWKTRATWRGLATRQALRLATGCSRPGPARRRGARRCCRSRHVRGRCRGRRGGPGCRRGRSRPA
jgi:phosphinothricin acetyltransferase